MQSVVLTARLCNVVSFQPLNSSVQRTLQVGLLHGLGKLLAHPAWGTEPQWAVCGESFPVGCAHSPLIACPQGFSVNPDRRRRMYNTPVGMYKKCASG